MEDFIIDINGKKFVDVIQILPKHFESGKTVVYKNLPNNAIKIFIKKAPGPYGHDSKEIIINRLIELDSLFFEGLGLWQGEGGKNKGLYFGNTCLEVLLHFLRFSEERIGLSRKCFKVTINIPELKTSENEIKKKWSKKLLIPFANFTNICIDNRINKEYAQIYINGIILSELMKNLHEKLKSIILQNDEFIASYIRGIIAGEGQIALKKWGTIAYVAITCSNVNIVDWYKSCLQKLNIKTGKYIEQTMKFPIYGRSNLEKVNFWNLCMLHPEKSEKFNSGISAYQREIMRGKDMEILILKQLNLNPQTYDEISESLNKGRSTIQFHYIPILESKNLIKRVGKRKRAWLFELTENGINFLNNFQNM